MKDSQDKKNWYSEVADAYNRVRPGYLKKIVDRVVELAQLPPGGKVLEIGCGPGTATTSFARLGFSMVCLEPSQEACQLARRNCCQYQNVEIINTTFEEWELQPDRFNAVLAATSFHWVSPEVGFSKAAATLKDHGSLILLWNTGAQPQSEIDRLLDEVYQTHAPSLVRDKDGESDRENLRKFVQTVIDSGWFRDLVSEQLTCELTYSIDDYLALLSTYSPYIMLEPQRRDSLFQGLRETLEKNCGSMIQLSYISAFQVARKR